MVRRGEARGGTEIEHRKEIEMEKIVTVSRQDAVGKTLACSFLRDSFLLFKWQDGTITCLEMTPG